MSGIPRRQRFSKSNPCRVCGKGTSFCAERLDGLIMCGHARDGEAANGGWRFVRHLGGNMGSLWAPAALFSSDDLAAFGQDEPSLELPKAKKALLEKLAEPIAPKTQELSEKARAKAHQNLSRQLELRDSHRQELMTKRGLSGAQVEILEREGFRSISRGQRFPGVQGAGFTSDGQYIGPAGLLIPARNEAGEIVGYQVAPDHPGEGGKYKWISGPEHSVDIASEWPVFQGATDRETSISYLVDGALKAALTGLLYDVPTLGVPGARFTTSGSQLLRVLAQIMPPGQEERLVVLMPDAGDVVNLSDMPSNLLSVAAFLRSHGYTVRFGWWGQVHKDEGLDIDEKLIVRAEDGSQIQHLTPDAFHKIVTDLAGAAPRRVLPNPKVGVRWVEKAAELPTLEITPPPREAYQYAKGERMEVLQSLQQRSRFTLDRSKPGSGKSWDITHVDPQDFGAAQIVMVARRALDVGAEFGIPALRGKDAGRIFNEAGRMVRAPIGVDPADLVMPANCAMAAQVEEYQQRNMQLVSANVCSSCSHRRKCGLTAGMFKHDKKAVIDAATYVCEPEALDFKTFCDSQGDAWLDPQQQEPGVVLMVDESASMPWVTTTLITEADLVAHVLELGLPKHRVRFNASFLKVLDALTLLIHERRGAFIPHEEVMAWIERRIREGEVEAADAIEISILEETLMCAIGGDSQMRAAWAADLLETLFGRGRIWLDKDCIYLMRPNQRFIEAMHHPAVRQVIFFDGTGAVTELEGWLGTFVEAVEERVPAEQATLEITQYVGIGRLGFTRKKTQEKQTEQLLRHLKDQGEIDRNTPVVDIKNSGVSRSRKPLTWLSTSRGSNAAAKAENLVIVGAPGPNLVAALNRYCLLYGVDISLEDTGFFHRRFWTASASRNEGGGMYVECALESTNSGFRNYYRALIEAELDQALHRLRGVRRPGETLRVHWVSDFCHPRWEVDLRHADQVVDVFTPVGLTPDTVEKVLFQLKKQNVTSPTHHRVAAELGVRSADVARWIESSTEISNQFGWLDRSRRESRTVVPESKPSRPVQRSVPREPIPDQLLIKMREFFPIGTQVTLLYDREKVGTVVEYCIDRGLPKFVVELETGQRSSFPRNLLTFPIKVA